MHQLIVLGGDIVDTSPTGLDNGMWFLRQLRARSGVLAVLGNHDFSFGHSAAASVAGRLQSLGFQVLKNQVAYPLELDSEQRADKNRLAFVGLGDLWNDVTHDQARKLVDSVPATTPRIVIEHNPDIATVLVGNRADLILSGHTHGGHIAFPSWRGRNKGTTAFYLMRKMLTLLPGFVTRKLPVRSLPNPINNHEWMSGLFRVPRRKLNVPFNQATFEEDIHNGSQDGSNNILYVNRGIVDPARRLFCDPEITVITLQ